MNDPVLESARRRLPNFSNISVARIVPDLEQILADNRATIATLADSIDKPDWGAIMGPLEACGDRLHQFWSPISHLHAVADNDELRAAYNTAIPKLSEYATEIAQNDRIFALYRGLRDGAEFVSFSSAQQRSIENALRDFRLGGIDLVPDERQKFADLSRELAELQARFDENVLDATQAWTRTLASADRLDGVPASALELLRQNARARDQEGYTLTLDFPSYMPVITYCDDRDLRREVYDAYVTRASEQGEFAGQYDNSGLIEQLLAKRHALARLLGYDNYAELSLATKMAPSVSAVTDFLTNLALRSQRAAARDYRELCEFASDELGMRDLKPWDVAYCSEKLRHKRYAFSEEELRAYFPAPRVINGLFTVASKLFDVRISEITGVDRWHDDVRVYQVRDGDGVLRGLFYLDLYARQHKRGGAWMDECMVRRMTDDGLQHPVAYLTCNFTPPIEDKPSLLTHDEVLTLFHEFGHGLHHLLTQVDQPTVAGINGVPWDGVELPSQFLENWCWEKEALDLISGHIDSEAPLPDELFSRLRAARNFQSGMQMVRQLEFALFDFRIHAEYSPTLSVQAVLDEIRAQVAVLAVPAYNRFQHSFSHIFAGGYSAGYYSYKWAEVLSADAFSRFEQSGIFDAGVGASFRECILEKGGSEDLMVLFERFRGRPPDIEALLKQAGLAA